MKMKYVMQFTLNGTHKTYDGDPELSLLTYLREHEASSLLKDGCAPQSACGCLCNGASSVDVLVYS
jgi:aerobic-type carbon monoxide dehydrogenase small subunit (CoxS/CutS family)